MTLSSFILNSAKEVKAFGHFNDIDNIKLLWCTRINGKYVAKFTGKYSDYFVYTAKLINNKIVIISNENGHE